MRTGVCDTCSLRCQPGAFGTAGRADPDIVIVGTFPQAPEIKANTPFVSSSSLILRRVVTSMLNKLYSPAEQPKVAYRYSVECVPEFDREKNRYQYDIDNINKCSVRLLQYFDMVKPKVIVAMGRDAIRSLKFKDTVATMRGGIFSIELNSGEKVSVIPTYDIAVIIKKEPGLFPTFKNDLKKAFRLAVGKDFGATTNAKVYRKADDIEAALKNILVVAKESFDKTGIPHSIAVDTETTSLTPSNPKDRVIAISLAYKNGEGLAYPFEHVANPFTPEEFKRIKDLTEEVLGSPYTRLIMCNAKFDYQWLKFHYGMNIHEASYDCQLAEHNLDEDKKGEYSLKDITKDRFPAMGRYEQELKEHLAQKQAEITKEWEQKKANWVAACNDKMLSWWCGLEREKRMQYLEDWSRRGYILLSDCSGLADVRQRKYKGEFVIKTAYKNAVAKMINNVPKESIPEAGLPERDFPDNPRKYTFEDADIDKLLWYAAIDAQTTRMIAKDQQPEFEQDWEMINEAQKDEKEPIQTVKMEEPFYNICMKLSPVIASMEYNGIRLDRDRCQSYIDTLNSTMEQYYGDMVSEVGHEFNTSSSSPDLANILYKEYGLQPTKFTDSGKPSTDADVLKDLVLNNDMPFLNKLLSYRKMEKVLHTYLENWMKQSELDGHIHCLFNQIGTSTFRLSSSNPNMQNVPALLKEANLNIKALFIPDTELQHLIELDISNAEMRVLCAYSKDKTLIDAFNNSMDLHCLTASGISEYTYDDIKKNKEDKSTPQYLARQLGKRKVMRHCIVICNRNSSNCWKLLQKTISR